MKNRLEVAFDLLMNGGLLFISITDKEQPYLKVLCDEAVAKRMLEQTQLTERDLADILDYLCAVANKRQIFFLWRPFLPDPEDDMVLELAVSAGCQYMVTFNRQHFVGSEPFGIQIVTPQEFLEHIGQRP